MLGVVASSWAPFARALDPDAADPAASALVAGISAYRQGDYVSARDRFLQAQGQGDASDELRFNLALSYYKLGEYPEAERSFEALRASPALLAVAEYHLGLVAAQTGQTEQAAAHWRATREATDSAELRQLADIALERLAATRQTPARWSAAATLGGGFDSNRTQLSDRSFDGVSVSDVEPESAFAELSGAARYFANENGSIQLLGSFYGRDYSEDRALDQYSAQFSLRKSGLLSGWLCGAAAEIEAVWFGGERFQNATGVNLDAQRSFGASSINLRYRPSLIAGAPGYRYLDGSSQRFELGYALAATNLRLRLQYEAEFNDRRDLDLGDEFFSQSAIRNGLIARLTQRVTPKLTLDASARYRYSRYRDPDRTLVGVDIVEQRRVDQLVQLGTSASLVLAKHWGLRLNYRYSHNQSRVEFYDYDRHDVMLGLDWQY